MLGLSGGKGTPAVLIALGMVNALTPRSIAFPLGFAAMLGASGVFAASGEWLGSLARPGAGGRRRPTRTMRPTSRSA